MKIDMSGIRHEPEDCDANQTRTDRDYSFHQPFLLRHLSRSCTRPSLGTTDARRQEMQRRELFHAGRVNIAKGQHVLEPIFTPAFVTALSLERLRILEGAKEHVP